MTKSILFMLFFSSISNAQSLKGIYLNNQGTQALKEQQIAISQQNLLKSLSEDPDNYVARFNLGLSFVFSEEFEKAKKEFEVPLKATNAKDELLYYAHFNKGRAHQELKEVESALKDYQDSLKYDKDSLQAKTNIELLVQQQNGQGKGGSGDEEQNDKNKDQDQDGKGNKKDKQKEQDQDGEKKDEKKKKRPQDLSEKDIEKILEELKNQEQKIRALEYGKETKEDPNGKTW